MTCGLEQRDYREEHFTQENGALLLAVTLSWEEPYAAPWQHGISTQLGVGRIFGYLINDEKLAALCNAEQTGG